MSHLTLEKRVARLEEEVAMLKASTNNGTRQKNWQRTVGMFTGDEIMKQIDEETRKVREADRRKTRRNSGKARRAKS